MCRQSIKIQKLIFIIFLSCIVIIIIAAAFIWKRNNNQIVAIVDNIPIEVLQWKAIMDEKRSDILVKYPSGLKQKEAQEELKQASLEECIRRQTILQLAKREGLIEQINYQELLKKMEQENKERKQKKEKGGIIYGIEQYNPQIYFTYLFNNLIPELITTLKEKELKIEEEELLQYYRDHSEIRQESPESASVIIWMIDENAELTQKEKKKELNQLHKKIVEQKNTNVETTENIIKTEVNVTRNSRIIQRDPLLEKEVFKLKEKEFSKVVENGENYFFIYCKKYSPKQKLSFEKQKDYLETILRKQKFDELINKKVKEADIKIKKNVYKSFFVE